MALHSQTWEEACRCLASADPLLGTLFGRYPGELLTGSGDAFRTLANAIVGQQISVKAAASIWARLEAGLGALEPEAVLKARAEELKALGLSWRKVEYLSGLARAFADGRVDPERWAGQDDETVIASLVALRGIGRWTAEMFLIFHLHRLDILPLDDIAFLRAACALYGWPSPALAGQKATANRVQEHAVRWQPYRTVAVWYLWRTLDPVPVVY